MKLLMKQRVFSWTDSYDVYDEQGNVRYFVKAGFFYEFENLADELDGLLLVIAIDAANCSKKK